MKTEQELLITAYDEEGNVVEDMRFTDHKEYLRAFGRLRKRYRICEERTVTTVTVYPVNEKGRGQRELFTD